jgi:tetratricopeptide (TPR) repeat protein
MKLNACVLIQLTFAISLAAAPMLAQKRQPQPEFIKQGQHLMREGKLDDALALYRNVLKATPDSMPANIAAGSALDLMGKGEEARKYFGHAIQVAATPEAKASANGAMAVSYAFERKCDGAIDYEQQVFDFYNNAKNYFDAGEVADEAARICLDTGDLDLASKWYERGHETGLKEAGIKPDRVDLWNFRWQHAQARIAAQRGDMHEAQKHVATAKSILNKGTIPQQAQFFPYLEGYVAFYAGDYKSALAHLQQANQNDPFIQCMIGQSYEKLGNRNSALEYYRKASLAASHNPPTAYAVPFSKKKLAELSVVTR